MTQRGVETWTSEPTLQIRIADEWSATAQDALEYLTYKVSEHRGICVTGAECEGNDVAAVDAVIAEKLLDRSGICGSAACSFKFDITMLDGEKVVNASCRPEEYTSEKDATERTDSCLHMQNVHVRRSVPQKATVLANEVRSRVHKIIETRQRAASAVRSLQEELTNLL